MPTALIADDEPHLAAHLRELLRAAWPGLQIVHLARHGLEAAERITALQPDVAFLDIQMPGLTGLEVAQGIEGSTRVVFVTAYDDYAVDAFDHAALDYVMKPVKADRLARTVERLQQALAASPAAAAAPNDDDDRLVRALQRLLPAAVAGSAPSAPLRWIRASQAELTHQIAVSDVLYFQSDEKYTVVHTTAGGEHLIRMPLQELIAQLDGERFWQVHRSTLINVDHLVSARRDEASRLWLRLKGAAQELPVSRAYAHRFKAM